MIDLLSHKTTRYSDIQYALEQERKVGLPMVRMHGVNVFTDCPDLYSQMLQVPETPILDSSTNFYYLTDWPIILGDTYELTPMSSGNSGEIYTDYGLNEFVFGGLNKFGTLISMVYGISALRAIEFGRLGVHSASLYDRELNTTHIIMGANKSGKSSISTQLEATERFILLADDWNEIDLHNNSVVPKSMVFSMDQPDMTKYRLLFSSFGKNFFTKERQPVSPRRLGKVIILTPDDTRGIDNYEQFMEIESHIPFVVDGFGYNGDVTQLTQGTAVDHFRQLVDYRLESLFRGYQYLVNGENVEVVKNDRTKTIAELSLSIFNLLDKP